MRSSKGSGPGIHPQGGEGDDVLIDPATYSLTHLRLQPAAQDANDIMLLVGGKLATFRDRVPFLQAPAATRRGGMLRDKDGVFPHRRLFTVVGGVRGRQPLVDKVGSVFHHHIQALAVQILALRALESEPLTEGRSPEPFEYFVEVCH